MIAPTLAWLILLAQAASGATPRSEPITLSGEVVELTDALKAKGLAFDAEPIAKQVVLRDRDKTLIPLLCDEGSRALFEDRRLRDRPAELTVKRVPSLPYVQVLSFRIVVEGTPRTPEYYCEICTISTRYPQTCPCCQGPMELRMRPQSP